MACGAERPAPFSDDPEAIATRLHLVLWKPLTLTQIQDGRNLAKGDFDDRPVRVYSDGVYDLFHNGHAQQLRQAKNMLPNCYLIVGVCSEKEIIKYKGTRPVMTDHERCEIVRHCRYVDEVVKAPPFYPTMEFINSIKVDLVAHDALPYHSPFSKDCYAIFKEADRFLATERAPIVSTTELLARILNNLETFQRREMQRKLAEQSFLECSAKDQ